jgi:PAS domain S-box-containing protein
LWLSASIANRITLAAVSLTMAVVLALGLISAMTVRQQIAAGVNADLEADACLVEQQLRNDLGSIVKDLGDLANNSFIANGLVDSQGRDTYLRPFLLEHKAPVGVALTISLLDFRGQRIASNVADSGRPRAAAAGAEKAIEKGSSQAELAGESGAFLLSVAMPVIFPPTGQPEGVIVGTVNLGEMFKASTRARRSEDLTDLLIKGAALSGGEGFHGSSFIRIERRLDLPPPLDTLSLSVVLARPKAAMRAAMRWVFLVHGVIGAATLLLVFTLARMTTRRLLLPLAALSRTANDIAVSGSLATAAKVSGRDEVGMLAVVFNAMIEKLRAARDELESQVEARTFELRQSEQRLLLHVQQTPLAAVEWDNNGRILRWNPAAERIFGYTPAEAIGKSAELIFTGNRRRESQHVWHGREARSVGSTRVDRHITKRGVAILCEWYSTPLTLADGQAAGVASLAQDVTARRRAEVLTGIQRDLSLQLSSTSNLGKALGSVVDATCRIEGIDCGAVYLVDPQTGAMHLAAHRGFSPDSKVPVAHYEADSASARFVMKGRTALMGRTGHYKFSDASLLNEGIRALAIMPILYEKRVIACLSLASHTVDVISADTRRALEAIAAQIGGTLARLRAEADLELSRRKLEELNQNLEVQVEQETRLRLEKECLLVQQSRLAAMGEMIGAIAHQWRQPLNSVAAVVQDLGDAQAFGVLDKAYLNRGIEAAMSQINFMSKTIDDFRNFFRPEKEKRVFDVKQAAAEVLKMLSPQLTAHRISCRITCTVHGMTFTDFSAPIRSCGEMQLLGYENEMKQVYLNLVANAKDAILERREQANAQPEEQGQIALEFARQGEKILIRVLDNGAGIPKGVLDRVFEPYFTTKEQGRGTGIGLYMSKMIVEGNMGGRISARNVDDGAEFTIEV